MKPGNAIMLLLAAFIWGMAFSAQSIGSAIGTFTFNGIRSLIGSAAILILILVRDRIHRKENAAFSGSEGSGSTAGEKSTACITSKNTWTAGCLCGLFLFMATTLQQAAIAHTQVGKASFLTALYIVIVPLIELIMTHHLEWKICGAVALAVAGLYLLCGGMEGFNRWDMLLLLCALFFSLQIMCIDHFQDSADGVKVSAIQFLVTGILSIPFSLILERPDPSAWSTAAIGSILYAGIFSSAIAYTLQIIGQKGADPSAASLLLSMESVFGAFSGWLILGETMSGAEMAGCALMSASIVLVQIPLPGKRRVSLQKPQTGSDGR